MLGLVQALCLKLVPDFCLFFHILSCFGLCATSRIVSIGARIVWNKIVRNQVFFQTLVCTFWVAVFMPISYKR